ncbi:MAG TPA: 7TM-DISM domain-containing protein, partial [Wenzhouxiangella sp.]
RQSGSSPVRLCRHHQATIKQVLGSPSTCFFWSLITQSSMIRTLAQHNLVRHSLAQKTLGLIVLLWFVGAGAHALADQSFNQDPNQTSNQAPNESIAGVAAYLLDPEGVLEIDDIAQKPWVAHSGLLSEGFQEGFVWLRIDLPQGQLDGDDWVVRLRPAWHDEVTLYDPLLGSQPRTSGALHPWSVDEHASFNINFLVPQTDQARSVYLRVQSAHAYLLYVDVHPWTVAVRLDQSQFAWYMGYFAFLFLVLFVSTLTWLFDREPVLAAFSWQLLAALIYGASMYGALRMGLSGYIDPRWLNGLNTLIIIAYPASVIWFYRALFTDYGLPPWAKRVFEVFLGLSAINFSLALLGFEDLALRTNAWALLLATIWALICPWFFMSAKHSETPKPMSIWVYRLSTLVLLNADTALFRRLGWVSGEGAALNGYLLHAFFLALLMTVILQYRARRRWLSLVQANAEATQKMVEEATTRKTLQQYMAMLSHEIKTPLSVVRLAVNQGLKGQTLGHQADQAIADINQLITRCLQSDQLAAGALVPEMAAIDLGQLVRGMVARSGQAERFEVVEFEAITLNADPWLTQIIVGNLIENALKYGCHDQPIEISCQFFSDESDPKVELAISNAVDKAIGFDEALLFEKFYRGAMSSKVSGAGLGLYLSRE